MTAEYVLLLGNVRDVVEERFTQRRGKTYTRKTLPDRCAAFLASSPWLRTIDTTSSRFRFVLVAGITDASDSEIVRALEMLHDSSDPSPLQALGGCFSVIGLCQDSFIVATERTGVEPVYECRVGGGLALSSNPRLLCELQGENFALSRDWLSRFLTCPNSFAPSGESPFQGVRGWPGGSCIKGGFDDSQNTSVESWWKCAPLEELPNGPAQHAIDLLSRGTQAQIDLGMVTASDLSGGLDSSMVSDIAFACSHSGKETDSPFRFVTSMVESSEEKNGDMFYARRIASKLRPSEHVCLDFSNECLPFGDLSTPVYSACPFIPSLSQATISKKAGILADRGVSLLFTGQFGDVLFHRSASDVLDNLGLPFQSKMSLSLRTLRHYGIYAFRSLPSILRYLGNADGEVLRMLRRARSRPERSVWQEPDFQAINILSSGQLGDYEIWHSLETRERSMKALMHDLESGRGKRVGHPGHATIEAIRWHARLSVEMSRLYQTHGVKLAFPLLDGPFVDFILSLPTSLHYDRFVYKPFLRSMLYARGLDFIAERRTSSTPHRWTLSGFSQNVKNIREYLLDSILMKNGFLEKDSLENFFVSYEIGQARIPNALSSALAAERWLRSFSEPIRFV